MSRIEWKEYLETPSSESYQAQDLADAKNRTATIQTTKIYHLNTNIPPQAHLPMSLTLKVPQNLFGLLPPEIFDQIIHLLTIQGDRASLLRLACTSKPMASACIPAVQSITFKIIAIDVGDRYWASNLRWEVEIIVSKLTRRSTKESGFSDVRRLIVRTRGCIHSQFESRWNPLITLIERLPALEEFCYEFSACHHRLPARVFDSLQPQRTTLRVKSEKWHRLADTFITPSGFHVVRCPSRIGAGLRWGRSDDEEEGSIDKALARRELLDSSETRDTGFVGSDLQRVWYTPALGDSGWIHVRTEKNGRVLPLESLKALWIGAHRYSKTKSLNVDSLVGWTTVADFSVLETLDLELVAEQSALEYWAVNLVFSRLRTLLLKIRPSDGDNDGLFRATERFLCSLPPLSQLDLNGWHSMIPVEQLVQRHGQKLRKLVLSSLQWQRLTKDDVLTIAQHCPVLEDLTLTLRRSQGNREQVECYKALGTVQNLQYLDLTLDVSEVGLYGGEHGEDGDDPSFDQFDAKACENDLGALYPVRNGDIRRILVNTCIDQKLASSIFHAICRATSRGCVQLERMIVRTEGTGGGENGHRFESLVGLFSSEWLVEPNSNALAHNQIEAKETKCDAKMATRRSKHLELWLETIFYRLWPKHQKQQRKVSKKLQNKRDKERAEKKTSLV
ncbi:hypothetical protein FE257_004249 [Aspergillus nanangensis]|uniref:Uncharacterized protein n=1 Tax=Aspergillus nanangensis TaxID=2582783 RepID=A0AAD4CTA4_ASPNN|nr:hypothetical protein FE257_004249 [Aspergillus nanangensis]